MVHAAWYKLFGFLLHNDLFRNRNISADGLEYSRNLYDDFACYQKGLEGLGLADLVVLRDTALNSCEAKRQEMCTRDTREPMALPAHVAPAHAGIKPLDWARPWPAVGDIESLQGLAKGCGRYGCLSVANYVKNVMAEQFCSTQQPTEC